MNIRNATADDAAAIAEFVSTLATKHIGPSLGDGGLGVLLESMNEAETRQRMIDGWPHTCAFRGDRIVGLVVVKPPTHLYHLFVTTELQGTGIGRKLLGVADQWSDATSSESIRTVNSSLNTVAIYNRFGFEADGPMVDTNGVRYQPMVRKPG